MIGGTNFSFLVCKPKVQLREWDSKARLGLTVKYQDENVLFKTSSVTIFSCLLHKVLSAVIISLAFAEFLTAPHKWPAHFVIHMFPVRPACFEVAEISVLYYLYNCVCSEPPDRQQILQTLNMNTEETEKQKEKLGHMVNMLLFFIFLVCLSAQKETCGTSTESMTWRLLCRCSQRAGGFDEVIFSRGQRFFHSCLASYNMLL